MACPDASWKKRTAKLLFALPSAVGILGTVPSFGTMYGLLRLPLLTILSLQLLTALRLSKAFMNALLIVGLDEVLLTSGGALVPRSNSLAAASPAHWSAISLPVTPAWPGTRWMETVAPLWHNLSAPIMQRTASRWPGPGLSSTRFMAAWESVKTLTLETVVYTCPNN